MNYVHELTSAMHDNDRFNAVVARLAADQSVKIFALREIVGLFVGFVPGEARRTRRRRALIQAITEHRTLDATSVPARRTSTLTTRRRDR